MGRTIFQLSEDVVNQIAAGEVIHHPASAVKEMIENSIDAKATSISVRCFGGGLKSLTIQDNGDGIKEEDLPLACERFATSKLNKFDDLVGINTYGFRGEALASISHVAKVSITSKTATQNCAFKANYINGKLADNEKPKPCAGVVGTIITAEDLFYNMPTRRKAIRNPNEEYARILDVVGKYAIHMGKDDDDRTEEESSRASVGMTCKKNQNKMPDLHTSSADTKLENIQSIYGASVARELMRLKERIYRLPLPSSQTSVDGNGDSFCIESETVSENVWQFSGYITNANYSRKKNTMIFFVNERLVDVKSLKRALDGLYAEYLPRGNHPFVYIAISVPTDHVDVNVSPNKREVTFLHEDSVVGAVINAVRKLLISANSSRTFYTQQTIGVANSCDLAGNQGSQNGGSNDEEPDSNRLSNGVSTEKNRQVTMAARPISLSKRAYCPKRLVRTDAKARKLDEYLVMNAEKNNSQNDEEIEKSSLSVDSSAAEGREAFNDVISEDALKLTSVNHLIKEFQSQGNAKLRSLLTDLVFVGWIDCRYLLAQIHTGLYMIDYVELLNQMFYQQVLLKFGMLSRIVPEESIELGPVLKLAMHHRNLDRGDSENSTCESSEKVAAYVKLLCDHSSMLDEYFRINIDAECGLLKSLPEIITGYRPLPAAIAPFLLHLCENVNWNEEKLCFRSIASELAKCYTQFDIVDFNEELNESWKRNEKDPRFTICYLLLPELRTKFVPQMAHADPKNGFVVQIAALEDLYKIFERC